MYMFGRCSDIVWIERSIWKKIIIKGMLVDNKNLKI